MEATTEGSHPASSSGISSTVIPKSGTCPTNTAELAMSGMYHDGSFEDDQEVQNIDQFMDKGCSCHLGVQGTLCYLQLRREAVELNRQDCLELSKNELDLVILSQINSHQCLTKVPAILPLSPQSRSRSTFYFHGLQVCFNTYLYLHCLSHKRYQNLLQHYQQHGLCPRMHGNTKRLPANSLPKEDIDYLITFITNYAPAHGVPLPGRVPGHRDKVLVLPADITKITCIASTNKHVV